MKRGGEADGISPMNTIYNLQSRAGGVGGGRGTWHGHAARRKQRQRPILHEGEASTPATAPCRLLNSRRVRACGRRPQPARAAQITAHRISARSLERA